MLAHRVIPVVLYRGHRAVKGIKFQSWRSIGHVQQQVRVYAERGCDELILLDIEATPAGRGPDFDLVSELTASLFCPVTVGGGVRSVEDVRELLRCGADKVAIQNSKHVIRKAAEHFGAQAIVCAIDHVDGTDWPLEARHAGEILLTSIARDGTLAGYELHAIRWAAELSMAPVIANGGCGTYQHMVDAIEAGASAVAAGAMFAWTDATPREAAKYLAERGIEARI